MQRLLLTVQTILLCIAVSAQQPKTHRLRCVASSPAQSQIVGQYVSVDKVIGDTIYAIATPDELAQLRTNNITYELLPQLRNASFNQTDIATTVAELTNWDKYPTFDVYAQMLWQLRDSFPNLCLLDSIGTSVMGRQLYMLRITNLNDTTGHKPKFLYSSTMHGDELTGFALTLRLAHYLCHGYASNTNVQQMLNTTQIFICPNLNPDGTYGNNNANIDNPTRYNANNKDLNRNFPHPNNTITFATAQPETQAIIGMAHQQRFTASASIHTGAEVICYPWDHWRVNQRLHPDNTWFEHICRAYADTVHAYAHNPNYFTDLENGVTHAATWYPITGSQGDYMNLNTSCREVTIELSTTKAPSPSEMPKYWNSNMQALLNLSQTVHGGISGMVRNAHGDALSANISIPNHDTDGSNITTNPHYGTFHRPTAPGNYQLLIEADGYIAQKHNIKVDSFGHKVYIDAILELKPTTPDTIVSADTLTPPIITPPDTITTPDSTISNTTTNIANSEEYAQNTLKIYPNPFSNSLQIAIHNNNLELIRIYSITGQLVANIIPNNINRWTPTSYTPKGVYFIVAYTKLGIEVYKVVYQ